MCSKIIQPYFYSYWVFFHDFCNLQFFLINIKKKQGKKRAILLGPDLGSSYNVYAKYDISREHKQTKPSTKQCI